MFLIVGLGNPEKTYEKTRHNAGFMAIDACAKKLMFPPFTLDKKSNTLLSQHSLEYEKITLAKPQTFMNNSGKAVRILYQEYKIRDWILEVPGTLNLKQSHFQDIRGLLASSMSKTNFSGPKRASTLHNVKEIKYMVVIHDDIDLPLGAIRVSLGNSSAGHKGVESIIQQTHTKDFARIRIGIQPESGKPQNVEQFVIENFTPKEQPLVTQSMEKTMDALALIITSDIKQAMNAYN